MLWPPFITILAIALSEPCTALVLPRNVTASSGSIARPTCHNRPRAKTCGFHKTTDSRRGSFESQQRRKRVA
ncbi:hypothetical protein BOTBODRAFT_28155, partial [Botryobasidium botryosum FD-172 SS1]